MNAPRASLLRGLALALALVAALACQPKPGPDAAARAYLGAWERHDYAGMYALLSSAGRGRVAEPDFVARYTAVEQAAGLVQLHTALGERADAGGDREARFPATVRWDTEPFGTFAQRVGLALAHEDDRWAVDWQPAMLLADLHEPDRVARLPLPAARGGIVDRHGTVLVPTALERAYPHDALAAQLLGYVQQAGTAGSDRERGAAGLEEWADADLTGVAGERLAIVEAAGAPRSVLAERPPRPGAVLELTLDQALQARAERLLEGKTGALIALDAREGSVLAAASWPTFDPASAAASGETPAPERLRHRALQGGYTVASLFKVIAMGAALESGEYDPATPFRCTGLWRGLGGGLALEDSVATGHGTLTLSDGLVASCNTVFYEVGKRLNALDPHLLPAVTRAYGLGSPTGIAGVVESAGVVPDPRTVEAHGDAWTAYNAVELAIGHGGLEATPLQLARLYAALATDGNLRRPVLVRQIVEDDGRVRRAFSSEVQAPLPLSVEHQQAIQAALRGVVDDPHGTAAAAFRGFPIPSAGKTGSAESDGPRLHALYAGYAPAEAPEIVAVAVVEYGGGGGQAAAPLVRGLLEAYFAGR